ncbi:TOMM precursor leader peptide-binding protein [Streptomyces sp. NBC_01433]|uniref:TOMM precursor leader peptide-binding protein n=1 Tax=Streptomyces sp. NBC_01433 TaxID=2903864 RepID=UPI00224FBE60|nr:TOMM precursor leader peptide-binding protein [Streptomyces sp. NBC_01433]MCX4676636.1 TOMM precursor leader peptide-binding protein [Streptomyces sp. NBC_01433]
MPVETTDAGASDADAGASDARAPDAVLAESTRRLAGFLAERLARHTAEPPPLDVAPLGVRDAFADVASTDSAPTGGLPTDLAPTDAVRAVPVRYYGQHAVVGPFPAALPTTAAGVAGVAGAGGSAGAAGSGVTVQQPCARCLERRWQGVRSVALREALELGSGTRAAGESPYVTPFGAEALAGVIAARLSGAGPRTGAFPYVHLVDLRTLAVRGYPLVPDPECPVCGRPEPDTAEAAALTLRPAPKRKPGSFRVRDIADYELPVEPYANPVCGSLGPSVVQDVSSTSTSATIGRFSMRSGEYLRETFWGGHADTFAESVRIGVLEGLERYAGMRSRAKRAQVRASLHALRGRGEHALDPRVCGLYSDAFHRANPRVTPFTPDREIPWVRGYSLRDHRTVLVPEVLTYYHAPGLENRFVQESSNGCASGGCPEEAVYFGLMEVVERDAFLLAWYGRAALPEIDPRTSRRPATRQMVDRLEMYGYEARFFDTRISFPVPVVTGVAVRPDGGRGRMCFGAGAGLDPEAALAGALCEIATDAVNLQGRTERDETRLRAMAYDFDKVEALHDHPLAYGIPEMGDHAHFLLGEPGAPRPPKRSFTELYGDGEGRGNPGGDLNAAGGGDRNGNGRGDRSGYGGRHPAIPVSDDLREDLDRCVEAVTGAGFDVIVVDQTMPEQRALGLTTVSVIVPGLLPIDFGWSRQRALGMPRLRTALREAGLRAGDLTDADLNPAPHPFP